MQKSYTHLGPFTAFFSRVTFSLFNANSFHTEKDKRSVNKMIMYTCTHDVKGIDYVSLLVIDHPPKYSYFATRTTQHPSTPTAPTHAPTHAPKHHT